MAIKNASQRAGPTKRKTLSIEHIGCTAVPGLGAKPIIDMMSGVAGRREADVLSWERQHSVGYRLHLVEFMREHREKHLVLRDFL